MAEKIEPAITDLSRVERLKAKLTTIGYSESAREYELRQIERDKVDRLQSDMEKEAATLYPEMDLPEITFTTRPFWGPVDQKVPERQEEVTVKVLLEQATPGPENGTAYLDVVAVTPEGEMTWVLVADGSHDRRPSSPEKYRGLLHVRDLKQVPQNYYQSARVQRWNPHGQRSNAHLCPISAEEGLTAMAEAVKSARQAQKQPRSRGV